MKLHGNLDRRSLGRRVLATLRPTTAPDVDITPERRILNRAAFGPDAQSLSDITAMGWARWVDQQIDWMSLDDSTFETFLAGLTFPSERRELEQSFALRCLLSRRQLLMKMTWFWDNHFNTDASTTVPTSEIEENAAFRQTAFGPFLGVLEASAKSPAMIDYLNNQTNVAANPNENYARELLELHTVGIDGGYTETDVAEAARVFTGWRRQRIRDMVTNDIISTQFNFQANKHDTGPKTVMGWSTPGLSGSAGVQEGESLLAYLAGLPQTVSRIARKLCVYLAADEPTQALVDQTTAVLSAPGATIADAVRLILAAVAGAQRSARGTGPVLARRPATQKGRTKTMDALEFLTSSCRRLGATFTEARVFVDKVTILGIPVFRYPVPTGLPEEGPAWSGAASQILRWSVVHDMTAGSFNGMNIDFDAVVGTPAPTSVGQAVDRVLDRLLDGEVVDTVRAELELWLTNRLSGNGSIESQILPHVPDLCGLVLRLPAANKN